MFPSFICNLIQGATYQQNKEDKENVGDKINWTQDSVGIVYLIKVEVPKDYSKLSETVKRIKAELDEETQISI